MNFILPMFTRIVIFFLVFGTMVMSPFFAEAADKGKKNPLVNVETAPSSIRKIEEVVEAVGTSKANRSVKLMVVSAGVVKSIEFKAGQYVEQGDVLLRLDDEIQRADLAEAQARLKEAELSLKRSRSLRKKDAVAAAAIDKLISEVEIARAERDRAERYLQDRTLRAPFAGRVGFSDIEIGSHLSANETVATLDDLSKIEVEFSLSENLFGKIHIGADIEADAAAFRGLTFKGKIDAIDSRIDAVSRSFKVRALMNNDDEKLPAGMFMHLSLVLDATLALSIAEEAVIVDGAQSFVFVVDTKDQDKVVRKQSVRLGRRAYGWVEVLGGVKEGERVVIRGLQKIRNGTLVVENISNDAQPEQGSSK